MKRVRPCLLLAALALLWPASAHAQSVASSICARPSAGSIVAEPEDLRSHNAVLNVELAYRQGLDANGGARYCYIAPDGGEAPTLRVKPGDLVILRLKNEIPAGPSASARTAPHPSTRPANARPREMSMSAGCAGSQMTASATNVHFHGLDLPPLCHQDDVLNTMIDPGSPPFEYRFRIPANQPPGLYWYHPHLHGFTKTQVLGGASGALIVEGIERVDPLLAGLPDRVFVIRDQDLEHPDAQLVGSPDTPVPVVTRDAEGDILNAGMDGGKPAKDLSLNFVPVSFPDYTPAVIRVRPREKQLWRVLNASAITYIDLAFMANGALQFMGLVSLDGNPMNASGRPDSQISWQSHILLPPAGRAEFVLKPIPAGTSASIVTRHVDTGPAGENDPTRTLATIVSTADAPEPHARLDSTPPPISKSASVWLGDAKPAHTRRLYFSENPRDPRDPNSPTDFFLTVDGQTPKLFDPGDKTPSIVSTQGDVEDWIIENRTRELHAFHIHQTHFMVLEWNGVPVNETFLRDTVNVSYWDGVSRVYPSVKLRIDFRDPNVVGTFVYHCHLLEHEDGGMMGLIRVAPKVQAANSPAHLPPRNHPLCGNPSSIAAIRSLRQRAVTYSAKNVHQTSSRALARRKSPAQNLF